MNSFATAPAAPDAADGRLEAVHLGDMTRLLSGRWRLLAGAGIAAFAASVLFVTLVPPRYTGEAKLILESRDSLLYPSDPGPPASSSRSSTSRRSRARSRWSCRAISPATPSSSWGSSATRSSIRLPASQPGPARPVLTGLAKNPLDRPPEDRVLETYYEHLLVFPVGKSRIVAMEFRSKDPELAAQGADTIAELYLAMQEAAKKDVARTPRPGSAANTTSSRGRVARPRPRSRISRRKAGLLLGTNNVGLNAQQLSDLSTQLAQARTSQADSQAKARLIREMIKSGRTFEIPDVANNELIRRLIEQRINLRAQLALELRTLLPEHPRIKELNAQVNDLEAQVRGAAERTVRTLENDAKIAGSRVETLQSAIDAQKGVVSQANEAEVQLRALEREARAQREQLESYLARYREATARDAENAVPPDARIVSRAITPDRPSFPKKIPIILFATLAAVILVAGWIVGRELLAGPSVASAVRAVVLPGRRGGGGARRRGRSQPI